MWCACWATVTFSAPAHISTVCASAFTWRGGWGLARLVSTRKSWESMAPRKCSSGLRRAFQESRCSIYWRNPMGIAKNFRLEIEREVRYANIAIIEGIGASQHGIGMVSARIAEIVSRDERAVIPIGSYHPRYGVTLSLPSVLGRDGAVEIIEPEMSEGERQALDRGAATLEAAIARIRV
jgi:lactate/malate dehydrogenase, alpha/beta C-terminal domain